MRPDIVLCDVRMQGASGLDLCREIRQRDPDRKVILLSVYDDEQYLFQAMRVGASGYLLKGIGSDELVRQLEGVHAGSTAIDAGMAARAAETAARLQSDQFWPGARQGLTQRESEILSLVVTGLSNRGIAAKLVIGEETVKTHLSSIYRKLGVGDRTSAAALALREGIFDEPLARREKTPMSPMNVPVGASVRRLCTAWSTLIARWRCCSTSSPRPPADPGWSRWRPRWPG